MNGLLDNPFNPSGKNGSGYDPVGGRAEVLADRPVREAGRWQPSDLIHTPYIGCRSAGAELRWDVLSAFARSVVAEMDCVKPPVIPSAMPAFD